MNNLINQLKILKKLGVVAVKQSLEDEGTSYDDLLIMRELTNRSKLKLDIKVGGCEDGMVAPMVESDYALNKFIQVLKKRLTS